MTAQPPIPDPAAARGLPADVAIVHDYLNQRGGAERVALELAGLFPSAALYTSLYRPGSTYPAFGDLDVRTSFLDRAPIDGRFRLLFPLYPLAFRAFGSIDAELVISSSSGWAHAVRTAPRAFHAVYCYTPARWLYGEYPGHGLGELALAPFAGAFRRLDQRAAARADLYIAISEIVRRRIHRRYGRDAPVVYPPVDVERFSPRPRGERLLVVSRLLPYKRVDLVVEAATRAGIGLDVVGVGPALADLRRRAGPTVRFLGRLADDEVTELFEHCRAFCLPGIEDFGIAPVEANAAGKPVVAFAGGGALETVVDGQTGTFFDERSVTSLLEAIARADAIDTPPERIAEQARRFSRDAFRRRLTAVLAQAMAATRLPRLAEIGERRRYARARAGL